MANWKVVVSINNNKEEQTVYVKDVETSEQAEKDVKTHFILNKPEVDFWSVKTVTEI